MISLRGLECLVTILDQGSLTRAAVVLHMSQPALSHQIAAIERELGTAVIEVAARPRVVVASKMDAVSSPERAASIRAAAERRGLPFLEISAATGAGLKELVGFLFHEFAAAPEAPAGAPEPAAE
jgi:50S ribosomal subunit-associated GTPase HflX